MARRLHNADYEKECSEDLTHNHNEELCLRLPVREGEEVTHSIDGKLKNKVEDCETPTFLDLLHGTLQLQTLIQRRLVIQDV